MFRLIAILSTVVCAQANAEELKSWKTEGDWEILIDASVGNGCLAQRQYDDGTLVQIGTVPAREGGFFAAYNAEWTDIEIGAEGTINFDFGDARFAGDAVGKVMSDLHGGYAFFDNPSFVKEFGKRESVKVSGETGKLVEIGLKGSSKAISAVLACQKEQPGPDSN